MYYFCIAISRFVVGSLYIIISTSTEIYKDLAANNELVADLKSIDHIRRENIGLSTAELVPRLKQANTKFLEVGCVIPQSNSRSAQYKYKLKGKSTTIENDSNKMEPLVYPLLFPFGEPGWGTVVRKQVKFMRYLAAKILMPEPVHDTPDTADWPVFNGHRMLSVMNKHNTQRLMVNRIQCMSRVGQTYIVDMMSRAIDYRLNWMRRNQNSIFGVVVNEYQLNEAEDGCNNSNDCALDDDNHQYNTNNNRNDDTIDPDRVNGDYSCKTFLADSFTGSPRHLRNQSRNALTVVSELGRPTLFITVTCNTEWPEIMERLPRGQTAFDRPDLVCMVFHQRLEALLYNLRIGVYFDGTTIVYIMRVIEYQMRGLPHAHIVLKLLDAPCAQMRELADQRKCIEFIDR